MNEKMKWGVIGCGGIADRRTIPGIMASDTAMLYAVMDRAPKIADAIREKYNAPKAYYTVEELVANPEIEAVYVATPLFVHYEQAVAVLNAGKHLMIEKPMAMTSDECRRILELAREKDLALTVGYLMRYHNLHQRMRDLIREGGIGRPVSMRAQFSCWYPDIAGAWRQKKELSGGGSFMDLGVHCLDLLQYITGQRITDIRAFTGTQTFSYEVDDSAAVLFRTEAGALGTVETNFNIPDDASISRLEIFGTKGSLVAYSTISQVETGTLEYIYAPQADYSSLQEHIEGRKETFAPGGKDLYRAQVEDFTAGIRAGKRDYTLAACGVRIQELAEAVYRGN